MGISAGKGFEVCVLAAAVTLAGCAVSPKVITPDEQRDMIRADQAALFQDQAPIAGPLTLDDALNRAVKYNLDHRLQQMQRVLEDRQLDLAHFDMLPRAMAQAGYIARNKENSSTSLLVETGTESGQASTSVEKTRDNRSLSFGWNILDFGVSYYQAQQSANRVLMMEERRRRVLQSLTQDVRGAFWQAYTAQEAEPEIRQLLDRVNQALADAERIERERLMPPAQILAYRKNLIEQAQQLEFLLADMVRARVRLAAMINAAPGSVFQLVAPVDQPLPEVTTPPAELELIALSQRPELQEARYETRNAALEARKVLLRLLPGIEFGAGYYYDSNKYLVNNDWVEGSMQVSWNIVNLFRYGDQKAFAEAQSDVVDARRLALTMAVIAQVHVAWHDYQQAARQSTRLQTLAELESALREQVAASTREAAGSQLEDIRAAGALVLAKVDAHFAGRPLPTEVG